MLKIALFTHKHNLSDSSFKKVLLCHFLLVLLFKSIFWLLLWTYVLSIMVESHVRIICLKIIWVYWLFIYIFLDWFLDWDWLNLDFVCFLCPYASKILWISIVTASDTHSFAHNFNFRWHHFFNYIMISMERICISLRICRIYVAFWLKAGLNMLNFHIIRSVSHWSWQKRIDSSIKPDW